MPRIQLLIGNLTSFTSKYMNKKNLIIFSLVLLTSIGMYSHIVGAAPTANELMAEKKQMAIKAGRALCADIANLTVACYTQNDHSTYCSQLDTRIALFTKEFGYTPELACPGPDSFLAGGAQR